MATNLIQLYYLKMHFEVMSIPKIDMIKIVENIINLDPQMRFVAIIDSKGNIVEAIMKTGKHSLKSQREEEHFCKQVAKRRAMRTEFDDSLEIKVRYVHVEREKLTQIVIYPKNHTVYITMEPELTIDEKLSIITKAKKFTSQL